MRTILISLLMLILGISNSYSTESKHEEVVFRETEKRLLTYIEDNTRFKSASLVPPIFYFFRTQPQLNEMYYGRPVESVNDVEALYSNGVAFFREDFELPRDEHILLHELFHHVVFNLGATQEYECRLAEERDAYELNNKFFKETGNGREYSGLWLMLMSCRAEREFR